MLWSPADQIAMRAAGGALRTRRNKLLWKRDPVAWVHDRLGEDTWSKQDEALTSVHDNPRTAVKSCHGIGKSHLASRAGLWWIDTADDPEDRFLVTTAPTWPQVKAILWRYMRSGWKAHDLTGTILQNAEWKVDGEIVGYGRKPADTDESAFQGIHAVEGVLVEIDEACGVPAQLFVAADALATNDSSRVLAIGNPDDSSAHFAKVCTTEPGWNVISISAFDSPNLTGEPVSDRMRRSLVTRWWVQDKQLRWGEQNPLYIAKVLGEFADSEDGLIPLSWVRQAQIRWEQWQDERESSPVRIEPPGRRIYGVDVARFGPDKTAIAVRQGNVINPDGEKFIDRDETGKQVEKYIETHAKTSTVEVANLLKPRLRAHPQSVARIDVDGIGGGTYDILEAEGFRVEPFSAAKATKRRDITGELRFANVRSASWYNLSVLLDPNQPGGADLALPPDDDLAADLTTPKWDTRTGGVIVVESKDEIKKRLGHSPDCGDAVVIACWDEVPSRPEGRGSDGLVTHADAYESDLPAPAPADPFDAGWSEDDEQAAEILSL